VAAIETQRVIEAGLPLKTLSVEVVEGPDKGAQFTGDSERVTVGTADDNDLKLTDSTVSRYHLELSRGPDRVVVADMGTTNGTEVAGVRLERGAVTPGTILKLGRTSLKVGDGRTVTLELFGEEKLGGLRGRTPLMRRLMSKVSRAAKSDVSVLLVGESGTGKELIAHALHASSTRAKQPFVTVDCGSLAPGLVASELFGHERGAFTGADRKHLGAFERAQGGTVFLDELGELPAALQAALLGVLERRAFRRVGGTEELSVDVRVVSATHRDLRAEVNRGSFRLDLFYRLAVVRLDVPALRERADDIPLLVAHFLKEAGYDGAIDELVSPKALKALQAHHWPGNVRELRNLVEATLAMGEPPPLDSSNATTASGSPLPAADPALSYKDARAHVLEAFEATYLKALLEKAKGNVSAAARNARMDRSHLIELLQRHGLKE
jgi:DNA-binding NtrC family response regulator